MNRFTTPDGLGAGTHVLTWRVVSEDGHPVAGSTLFSIGAPSKGTQAEGAPIDWPVRSALWLARIAMYVGLFFGIGGVFVTRWLTPGETPRLARAATLLGLVATVLSLGLQGLDALGAPLAALFDPAVWKAGFATSFGAKRVRRTRWTWMASTCRRMDHRFSRRLATRRSRRTSARWSA